MGRARLRWERQAKTTTLAPRLCDAATRRSAPVRSGAVQAPAGDGSTVNGQVGRYPERPGGSSWQAGEPAPGPPVRSTTRPRSTARLSARRTRGSSKGGAVTLSQAYSVKAAVADRTRVPSRV